MEIRSLREQIKKLQDELMASKSELEQQKIVNYLSTEKNFIS
jgi:hypothetical protein